MTRKKTKYRKSMQAYVVRCRYCGTEMVVSHAHKRYCSDSCRVLAYRARGEILRGNPRGLVSVGVMSVAQAALNAREERNLQRQRERATQARASRLESPPDPNTE